MTTESTLYTGPFDCDNCGKHVGDLGRSESPSRVVIGEPPDAQQFNYCGKGCVAARHGGEQE